MISRVTDAVYMQIVAHQDDDLLFMNPDLQNVINTGSPITTVFLTAGEADRDPGDPKDHEQAGQVDTEVCGNDQSVDREYYADCRARGSMAAWARMAGASTDAPWTRTALRVSDGTGWSRNVEVDTLDSSPHVRLVFVNLPDWADDDPCLRPEDDPTKDMPGAALFHILADRRTVHRCRTAERTLPGRARPPGQLPCLQHQGQPGKPGQRTAGRQNYHL